MHTGIQASAVTTGLYATPWILSTSVHGSNIFNDDFSLFLLLGYLLAYKLELIFVYDLFLSVYCFNAVVSQLTAKMFFFFCFFSLLYWSGRFKGTCPVLKGAHLDTREKVRTKSGNLGCLRKLSLDTGNISHLNINVTTTL